MEPTRRLMPLLAVLGVLIAVSYGGTLDQNATSSSLKSEGDYSVEESAPFPGTGWIDRIATLDSPYVGPDGGSYSSAYAALLRNSPLSNPCRNFNCFINSFFFSPQTAAWILDRLGVEWGHYFMCYLRNFMCAMVVYYGTALVFHYFCYIHPQSKRIFADRPRPAAAVMFDQIALAQASMILYVLLPVFDEFLIEQGYTRVYFTIGEIGGWFNYAVCMILYFACVEIGIYWVHRTLHTNKFLYKHVHMLHHKYNKPETLTPWASIAFHPLDGILQASPYVAVLPLVPCHYITHVILLFFTAIWATYIHDAMDFNVDPIMGSKYHTLHHTHYIYNYGQVFTFCDRFWGTFRVPDGKTGVPTQRKNKAH